MRRATIIIALLALVLAAALPQMAMALGTLAGETVDNSAVLSYTVGGSGTLTITNTTSFTVDRKVNFTVTKNLDGTPNLQPGVVNSAIYFTVSNLGNDAQSFMLQGILNTATSNLAGAGGGVSNLEIYIDTNGNNTLDIGAGDTLYVDATSVGSIPADGTIDIWIVGDAPGGITDGQQAEYWLIANATSAGTTTLMTNTAGANTAGVDTVLADGAGGISALTVADITYNNVYSASGTFTVAAAVISFSKSATLVWDPINYDNGNQKAIPGAYIEYVLIINNTGTGSATMSNIVDTLSTSAATDGVNLIVYKTSLGATPVDGGGQFQVTCVTTAGDRACDGGAQYFSAGGGGVTYTGNPSGTITLDLSNAAGMLPSEGAAAHFSVGEVESGDVITIKYMVQIVQ